MLNALCQHVPIRKINLINTYFKYTKYLWTEQFFLEKADKNGPNALTDNLQKNIDSKETEKRCFTTYVFR